MVLNNFGDIVSLTKKRCNISDITDFDDIVSTAINSAYTELKKKEPTVVSTIIPSTDNIIYLPDDCDSIISIKPSLYANEHRVGNNIILDREKDDVFSLMYTVVPDFLSDADIPEINKKYFYALSTYGCYGYYNYKKKHNEATAYMQEYLRAVDNAQPQDEIQNEIQNVYSSVLNGVDVWQGF